MSDDPNSSSETEPKNNSPKEKDDNGILDEAIEAASKESSKKKRKRGISDGEWIPPSLRRPRERLTSTKAKQAAKQKEKKETAGKPVMAPVPQAAATTLPPPAPQTYGYPIVPPYMNPYTGPYYPYPYPYSQPYVPPKSTTATNTTKQKTTNTSEPAQYGEKQGDTNKSGKGEAKSDGEEETSSETKEGEEKKESQENEAQEESTKEAVQAPAPSIAAPKPAPVYPPTYNPTMPQYSYPSYPMTPMMPFGGMPTIPNSYANPAPLPGAPEPAVEPLPKKKTEEELPPFLAGLKVMYPKKAELTIDAIKAAEGGALQYEETNYHAMHQNGIRNMAEHLDYILYTGSRGNCQNAAAILKALLRRPNLESVKQHMAAWDVRSKESKEQARKEQKQLSTAKVDAVIVQGLKDFLHSHRTSSLRRKHEYDAVEAVLTAACSAGKVIYGRRDPKRRAKAIEGKSEDEEEEGGEREQKEDRRGKTGTNSRWGITQDTYNKEEFPLEKVAKRLNRDVEDIAVHRNELAGKPFVPRKQKTREDYWRENPEGACILEFCHSIESSWPASKNETARSAFRPVKNPITGEREEHRVRVWHEEAAEDRYADFLQSNAYGTFLAKQHEHNRNNPHAQNEIVSIDFETFCNLVCSCVLDFHPKGKDRKRKKPDLPLAQHELVLANEDEQFHRW